VEAYAAELRQQIFERTKCTASIGIGANKLLARLATKKAKPDRLFHLRRDSVDAYLRELSVRDLPGVGWELGKKLEAAGVKTVEQLRSKTDGWLQSVCGGAKTVQSLMQTARGIDKSPVEPDKPPQTIGAQITWGVRFQNATQVQVFVAKLANEVAARLAEARLAGRSICVKLKRRRPDAGPPHKHLGHGPCDDLSKSVHFQVACTSAAAIGHEAHQLVLSLNVPPDEVRGIGITIGKLSHLGPPLPVHAPDPLYSAAPSALAAPQPLPPPPPQLPCAAAVSPFRATRSAGCMAGPTGSVAGPSTGCVGLASSPGDVVEDAVTDESDLDGSPLVDSSAEMPLDNAAVCANDSDHAAEEPTWHEHLRAGAAELCAPATHRL
jgi:DNA repair protein REV1